MVSPSFESSHPNSPYLCPSWQFLTCPSLSLCCEAHSPSWRNLLLMSYLACWLESLTLLHFGFHLFVNVLHFGIPLSSSSFWWVSSSTLAKRAWICCGCTASCCCAISDSISYFKKLFCHWERWLEWLAISLDDSKLMMQKSTVELLIIVKGRSCDCGCLYLRRTCKMNWVEE